MRRTQILFPLILLIFSCTNVVLSQGIVTTSVPFLLISPSPEGNGQGTTSVSRITDDPYAVIYNPAHLGLANVQTNIMFAFYPTKTNWLPGFGLSDLTYNCKVISGGITLGKNTTFPISIGYAYSRVDLNLGKFNITGPNGPEVIGTFNAEEHADAYSIGIGIDFGIKAALGSTSRRIVSNLAPFGTAEEYSSGSAKAWAYDFGFLLQIPVTKLIKKESEIIPGILPICNISLGTAVTNVGGRITYIDPAQADPLPRNISLGTTVELGLVSSRIGLKLITLSWSRETANLLVGGDSLGRYYRGGFGDIDYFENIVLGKRTTTIDLSQGWEIGILETACIRGGSFEGTGNRSFSTSGYGLRTTGFFKILKGLTYSDGSIFPIIFSHLDIRYDTSLYEAKDPDNPLASTRFSSITLTVRF